MSDVLRIKREGAVARVTLDRPEVHNALNAQLIDALYHAFVGMAGEPPESLRAVVMTGEGASFCAGADIAWQRAALALSMADNQADAARLQAMLTAIDECPVPVVARVHGVVLGGGMGLCSVADIVLAAAGTTFGFTETKLGIMPAVISPFVLAKIGETHARALFPGGERFDAERAQRIGLVHEVLPDVDALDARVDAVLGELLTAGPNASRGAKAVIRDQRWLPRHEALALAVERAARQRVSPEGQEGLAAFLDKRRPSWRRD